MRGLCAGLLLGASAMGQTHDWTIVPGERVGPVTRTSTLESLKQQFGVANVREESIVTGDDGVEHAAAILYPDTP